MAYEPYAIAATREDCSRSLSRECSRRGDRVIRNSSKSTKKRPTAIIPGDESKAPHGTPRYVQVVDLQLVVLDHTCV